MKKGHESAPDLSSNQTVLRQILAFVPLFLLGLPINI